MLAANNGRADLCARLLDAGARAASTDGAGLTALHSACVDLGLVAEKVDLTLTLTLTLTLHSHVEGIVVAT